MPDPIAQAPNPSMPSADYSAMKPFWDMVETILGGTLAIRKAGKTYLPKFPNETDKDYDYRCLNAKFTNIYRDIVEGLASKPFAKEVQIKEGSGSKKIEELLEDIDGQGNHLHVFAANLFFQSINDAIDWVFVDKPPVPFGASVAVEKEMGVRPYWIHVPAKRMLAVYSAVVNGKEEFIHCRIHEPECIRVDFKETYVNRVREIDRPAQIDAKGRTTGYGPAEWRLWEEQADTTDTSRKKWVIIDQGLIAIGVIAIAPFITGRRKEGSWQFVPPMQDAAYLQIEHYQQETNLKSIKEHAAFPMLAGNGVTPPTDESGKIMMVPVGPKTVLYAPMSSEGRAGSWQFIEPNASSLTFLAADVKATDQQLRELGRQPLTAQSANMTVVTAAANSAKGSSAVQAWAMSLKDCLEQAFKLTCMWLPGETSEPEVVVFTDFAVDLESDKAPEFLLKLREGGEISRKALLNEAKRRDFLSSEYDADKDMEEILKETPDDPTEQDVEDALPPDLNPDGTPKVPPLRIVPAA